MTSVGLGLRRLYVPLVIWHGWRMVCKQIVHSCWRQAVTCAALSPRQVEEWGEAYQALSWGPLIELVKADLQPNGRKDKARLTHQTLHPVLSMCCPTYCPSSDRQEIYRLKPRATLHVCSTQCPARDGLVATTEERARAAVCLCWYRERASPAAACSPPLECNHTMTLTLTLTLATLYP